MDFINTPLDLASLPAAEQVALQPVHANYRKILRIEWAMSTAFLVAVSAALIFFIPALRTSFRWLYVITPSILLIGWHYFIVERSFPFLAYAVREKDVIMQRGWLIRSVKICPFNRIQNCSVQSGPLDRRYRLASLVIYTAGSEGADMRIPGVPQEEADRLRYYILERIHTESHETV